MHKASLYQRVNNMQRQDAKCVIKEYSTVLQWRLDGRDRLLDVGCGSGNVLMELLYPLLPHQFEELRGTDISTKMIDYANKLYSTYEKTKFQVLDIANERLPLQLIGQYDHVTSFYCLHWVQNQRMALRNIYNLLRADCGDCLLVFLVKHPLFLVYKKLSLMAKWQQYMQDVDRFISPLYNSLDAAEDYRQLLQETGFSDYRVELRNEAFNYEGLDDVKDNLRSVNPFLERIPQEAHDDFMNDLMDIIYDLNLHETNENEIIFKTQYQYAVVYARKSERFFNRIITVVDEDKRSSRGIN